MLAEIRRFLFDTAPVGSEAEVDPRGHLVCGVPECEAGYIAEEGPSVTVVECDVHNARTTHDTVLKEPKEQQIIRVQDQWRQHGTRERPR